LLGRVLVELIPPGHWRGWMGDMVTVAAADP
jgi:hypothetical protein